MSNFDNMGKEELRAACKKHTVKGWGKMNNTQMREALNAQTSVPVAKPEVKPEVQAAVQEAIVEGSNAEHAEISKLSDQIPVDESRKPVVEAPVVTAPAAAKPAGTKIQKDRAEQNGVKRPSAGTICAHIWNELDTLRAANKDKAAPTFKDLKTLQDKHGWQRNTAVTQYQRWKEFNDLMVR